MILIGLILLANLLTRGPDLLMFLSTPSNQWFTGQASWFDPWDINVYLTAINWGHSRHLLLNNRYDSTDSSNLLLYPVYTLAGFLTSPFSLSAALTFHLLGLIVSCLLIIYLWHFFHLFLSNPSKRRMAMLIAVFSGGLGWLVFPLKSADLTHAGFTLAAALRTPHEGLSLLLYLVAIQSYFKSQPYLFLFTLVGLCLLHPYMLLPIIVIICLYSLISHQKKQFPQALNFLLLCGSTAIAYYLLLGRQLLQNPSFYNLFHQAHIPFTLTELALGFGIFLIPLFFTLKKPPHHSQSQLLLTIWFLSQLSLLFLPLPFSRLFVRGLWIPGTLLITQGIYRLIKTPVYRYFFISLGCLSLIFITYRRSINLNQSPWVRLPAVEAQILQHIPCTVNSVIIASHPISSLLPTLTLCRVYAGHQVQTPHFANRHAAVTSLLEGQLTASAAASLLESSHASYIFWGENEQALSQHVNFPYPKLVTPVISLPGVTLYHFSNPL